MLALCCMGNIGGKGLFRGLCELVSLCELISNLKCENKGNGAKKHITRNGAVKLTKLTQTPRKLLAHWCYMRQDLQIQAHTISSHAQHKRSQGG